MVKEVLKTADWDDSIGSHNALATESSFLYCTIITEFNRPATATCVLADPTGSIMQKYDVDPAGDSVYVGPGRAYIYDDDDVGDASIFDGRIVRATANMKDHTVTLECEDWLSQLDDDRIDHDMREELNASHLRQSNIHTDADNGTYVGPAYGPIVAIGGAVIIDGVVETDDTADANDADINDVPLFVLGGPQVGDAFAFGFTNRCGGMRVKLGTAGTDTYTVAWYYSTGADAWTAISVTDGTTSFTVAGTNDVTWTPPSDWATDEVGGIAGKYWIKVVITAYTDLGGDRPTADQIWALEHRVYDDDMAWAADTYNDKYLVFAGGMAGSITVGTGPYGGACSATEDAGDFQSLAYSDTWVDNITPYTVWDNDEDWTSDFYFRVYVGHNTPSDFYVHDSISDARIILSYSFRDSTPDAVCALQIYDNTGAAWVNVADLPTYDNARGTIITKTTITIPATYLDDLVSSAGISQVRFNVTRGSGTAYLYVYYLRLEVDVDTTGYSSAMKIYDTTANSLLLDTDMTAAATRIWEGIPYAIAKPIYKHIENGGGETGTLVTDGDTIYAMTAQANIEHTTGISTRHYIKRTRLEILQDLAGQDKAVFWVVLGTVALTWKSTFNNGAPTAITDASVLNWMSDWNYKSMFNRYYVDGARIGDYQIEQTDSDATSLATYGIYRTKVVKNTGVLSDYDCAQMADKLVTKDKDVKLYLQAELAGLSTLRLGDEVSITSTYLGLTAQVYTVTHWAYDGREYKTSIRLHPRASTTGYQENVSLTQIRSTVESQNTAQQDKYVSDLYTQEWS